MVEGILVEGLIYAIMVLGVFITFRIMNFPDLTVDGTFPLGAAIMAATLMAGGGSFAGLFLAFAGGFLAGMITALIHNKLKIPGLLASILTMTMLYSINIRILGNRPNVQLLRIEHLLARFETIVQAIVPKEWALFFFFFLVVVVIKLLLDLFFRTDMGLTIGAMGNNEQMVISQGVNPATLKYIGIGLSNALVGLSGAFAAMYLGYADVGLGQGIIISGLASVMLGELFFRSNRIFVLTLGAVVGSLLYKAIMFFGRYYGYYVGLTPNDLKLISGLLIIVSIVISQIQKSSSQRLRRDI
ncbi:MAG: ABC transporter permease [Brevinematales bacterium]